MRHLPVIFAGCLLLACAASGTEVRTTTGIVTMVQLIDASALGEPSFLIVTLEGGANFQLPDQQQLPAGRGVRLEISYLALDEPDLLPEACSIRVLAIPIVVDGEEILREAERPFEIYRNPRAECL